MTDVIVTMQDVRMAKMCSKGTRAFFMRHNLDWQTFLEKGLPVEVIEATGDGMALKVVEVARGRGQ